MKIIEIGPGVKPIEWCGEAAEYVGIDYCYKQRLCRDEASETLVRNENITIFGLVPSRVEYVEFSHPPDAVYMRDVFLEHASWSCNLQLVKHALRLASGNGPVFVAEQKPPRNDFYNIQKNLASENIHTRVLSFQDVGFKSIWEQISASREPGRSSRIFYIERQLNLA
ncbi:MAG: hypothetical protein AAB459_00865 [Patescibacteria group bacterium]